MDLGMVWEIMVYATGKLALKVSAAQGTVVRVSAWIKTNV